MAYIEPNSVIKVCRGIPFEPDYEHTVLFASEGAQSYSIGGNAKYTFTPTTYQRVNKETIRLGIKADNLYDCNYLMFQNTNFGTKWFYAFITSVEYINNECTEIGYEIDVWQTYLFDFRIDNCFVEREHSLTDQIGDNIIDEGLQTGDYVFDSFNNVQSFRSVGVVVITSDDTQPGYSFNQIFCGGLPRFYNIFGASGSREYLELQQFLQGFLTKPENVFAMYMCPSQNIIYDATTHIIDRNSTPSVIEVYNQLTGNETFGSYTPKNKKLYTMPYNFFHLSNGMGQELSLRYEFFNNLQPRIKYYGCIAPPAVVTAYPSGYKGTTSGGGGGISPYDQPLTTECISISGWGECSWANDGFKLGMLNTLINTSLSAVNLAGHSMVASRLETPTVTRATTRFNKKGEYAGSSITQTMRGAYEGARIGVSGVSAITDLMGGIINAKLAPSIVYGSTSSGGALAAHAELGFYYGRCRITEEYARSIDSYFNMFGYKCNKLKVPNINTRPHWNYVKAYNCTLLGESLPASAAEIIKQTLSKGITFWKSMSEVGMYGYDNSPV